MRNGASCYCSTRSCQSYCIKTKKNYSNCHGQSSLSIEWHSPLLDYPDLDTSYVSFKSFCLNAKSDTRRQCFTRFSIIYCKPVSEYAFTHPRLRSCYHIWLKEILWLSTIRVRYSKQLRNSIQCACSRSSWLRPSLRRSRFIWIVTHHSSSSSSSSCSFYWGGASREETKTPARETNYAPLTSTIINYM